MMLAWFLFKRYERLRKLSNGKSSSIRSILWLLLEALHILAHFSFNFSWCSCLVADVLSGNVFLKIGGRSTVLLERPFAASFASSSTFSLPFTSLRSEE